MMHFIKLKLNHYFIVSLKIIHISLLNMLINHYFSSMTNSRFSQTPKTYFFICVMLYV